MFRFVTDQNSSKLELGAETKNGGRVAVTFCPSAFRQAAAFGKKKSLWENRTHDHQFPCSTLSPIGIKNTKSKDAESNYLYRNNSVLSSLSKITTNIREFA
jgi:hypothetical protein